jgi:hypothetical protein
MWNFVPFFHAIVVFMSTAPSKIPIKMMSLNYVDRMDVTHLNKFKVTTQMYFNRVTSNVLFDRHMSLRCIFLQAERVKISAQ